MPIDRGPAYQYYPDKYQAGTAHLSDSADRAYRRVLDWMWLHSKNGYSMVDDLEAWKDATGFNGKKLKRVRAEILKPHWKLLQKRGKTLTSLGLRKEAKKQLNWREKSRLGGKRSAENRLQSKGG